MTAQFNYRYFLA